MPSGLDRWCRLLLVWLMAATAFGAVVTVTETSEPVGLVTKSTLTNAGTPYTSTSATLDQVGNRFAYWKINGERQVDSVGRAANPVVFTPVADTTLVAVYLPATQDSDADGIPDWYEYEYFGDLTKDQMTDSDADQLSVAVEILFGTHPLLVNTVSEGGLSRRGSGVFLTQLDAGFYSVRIMSEPSGLVDPVVKLVTGNALVTVPTPPDPIYGYRFAGWYVEGVRADSPLTLQPATIAVNRSVDIVAKYVPEAQDFDADGVADWLEWYVSSGTFGDGTSDADADSFSLALELVLGYSPNAANLISEGGLSRRASGIFQANLAGLLSLTIRSEPPGLVAETQVWRASGEVAETQEIWDSLVNGYRFVGWRLDGVDVREPWGTSKAKVSTTLTTSSVAVARYVLETQDSDADGIPDWLEWLYAGSLDVTSASDADADGAPWSVETIFGWHPGIVNTVSEGGLSRRSSATGNFILNWQPTITQQLTAVQGVAGAAASLAVSVTGPGPFSYEWRKNGEVLAQVAGDSMAFPSLSLADAGRYQVKVTNAYGSMQSNAVLVMVDGLPVLTRQPSGVSAAPGASRMLGVEVDGNGPFSYQWRKGGVNVAGATSATLSFPSVQLSDAGNYDVVVSNAAGSVTSAQAALVVEVVPTLSGGQTGLVQRALGNTLVLQGGTATGSGPLAYQWYKDGVPLRGGTAVDLTMGPAQAWMSGWYWLRVSNGMGWVEGPRVEVSVSGTVLAKAVGVKGWGSNVGGVMGDAGPSGDVARPLWGTFWGAGNFRSFASGERHGLAVDDVGAVFSWGAGESGQLGLGAGVTIAASPTQVTLLEPAVQVAVGSAHSVALTRSGALYVWGANEVGQLGIGVAGVGSAVPVKVETGGVRFFSVVATGNTTFGLNERGEVYGWGANTGGWLGSQVVAPSVASPVRIGGALLNKRVRSVAVGGGTVFAVTDDGVLYGWGANDKAQIAGAVGATVADPVAVLVVGIGARVLSVAAGHAHAVALMSDGAVLAWGDGARGQLGNGLTTGSNVPVAVDLSTLNGASVSMVGAGGVRSVMATLDGRVWVWGGATTDVLSPVQMPISSGAVNRLAVSALAVHVWWREAKEVTVPPVSMGVLAGGWAGLRGYQSVPGGVVRYQWKRESEPGGALVDVPGQVGTELAIGSVDASSAGKYALEVVGSTGRAMSDLVTLEVVSGPPVVPVVTPAELAFVNGGNFTIPFVYEGIYVPSFQWKQNGVALVGATSKTLMGNAFGSQKTGTYSVVVTNPFGEVERVVANVSLARAPLITEQPVGGYRRAGTPVGLSVMASGVPAPSFQWKRNGVDLVGQSGPSLSFANFGVADEGSYSVAVSNLAGSVLSSAVPLAVAIAPEISVQPLGRFVLVGGSVTMQVAASGTPSPSYQWRKGGALIAGATGSQLSIGAYAATDAGDYTVEVTNVGGSVTSGMARLQTGSVPAIGTQPVSQAPVIGANVTLSVGAMGVPALAYQWKKNGVALSGATGAQLVVAGYQATDAGNYSVVVSNEVGSVESQVAVLGTGSVPVITTQPVGKYVLAGGSVSVGVVAGGVPMPTYQWQRNGVSMVGATGAQLDLTNWSEGMAGDYAVVVSNVNGSVTSAVARLSTGSVPVIGTQPVSQTPALGINVTLGVGATGVPALAYQWKKNGVAISGATGAQLVVTGYQATNAGNYTVVVSNEVGSVESQVAVLGTGSVPVITTQPVGKYVLAGGSVSVGVVAGGVPVPTYQWQRNGVAMEGATGAQLSLTNWSEGMAGNYAVVVSNANGSVTSAVARLQTGSVPVIATQPSAMTLGYGARGTLSVVSSGVPAVVYQWSKDGVVLNGATGASLELTGATGVAGVYKVRVSNEMGAVESATATVTYVEPVPVQVVVQPFGGSVLVGSRRVLSVTASGTDVKYQWRKDGVDVAGAVGSELVIAAMEEALAGRYSVRVYNGISEVVSGVAELKVLKAPVVAQGLVGGAYGVGTRVTLRVSAQSDEAATYVWKRGGVVVSGAVGPEFVIEESAAVAGRVEYAVEVSNRAGSVVSGPVVVRHLEAPVLEKGLVGASVDVGSSAVLSVGVRGEELEYVWKRNGAVVAGATRSELAVGIVGFGEAGLYVVEAKNAVGKVESGPVGLWIKPRWVTEPTGAVALVGSVVRLRGSAEGSGTLTYRWMRDGQWVSGATGAELEVSGEMAQEGRRVYRAEVSGSGGVVMSGEVAVEYQQAVAVVERPADVWVRRGGSGVLGVKASGSAVRYQWKKGGSAIAGAVGAQLVLERVEEGQAGAYSVVVSNAVSSVEVGAMVRIAGLPVIRSGMVERRVAQGSVVDLRVDAGGEGLLSYQWYRNGVMLEGARSEGLALGVMSSPGVFEYEVEVGNVAGSVRGRVARVVVMGPVKVNVPVSEVSVRVGERLAFGVSAVGGEVGYEWRKNGVVMAGVTGAGIEIAEAKESDGGEYVVDARNDFWSARGSVIRVVVRPAVEIRVQPLGVYAVKGGNAVLRVVAEGSGALSYEWRRNGVGLSGGASSVYTIPVVGQGDAGMYSVVVRNERGVTVESRVVEVKVGRGFGIVEQPEGGAVAEGGSLALGVKVSGSVAVRYQWYRNGEAVVGGIGSVLRLSGVKEGDAGVYRVRVTDGEDVEESREVEVKVMAVALIDRLSGPDRLREGGSGALEVFARSGTAMSYQWYKEGLPVVGAIGARLELREVGLGSGGYYEVEVKNAAGTVKRGMRVEVVGPLEFVVQPVGGKVAEGGSIRMTAVAESGGGSVSYEWRRNGEVVAGVSGSSLELVDVKEAQGGEYRVVARSVVRGQVVETQSAGAVVVVTYVPRILKGPEDVAVVEGKPLRLAVEARGSGRLEYRWYREGVLVEGASGAVYEVAEVERAAQGRYAVEVRNEEGMARSLSAYVVVRAAVNVVRQPGVVRVVAGGVGVMGVGVEGEGLQYAWERSVSGGEWVAVAGGGAELEVKAESREVAGRYRVKVRSGKYEVVSTPGELVWVDAPVVRAMEPALKRVEVPLGARFAARVDVGGTGPFSVKWRRALDAQGVGEVVWEGSGLEYVLGSAGRGASGWYYAEVSNEAGRVESGRVEVAVLEAVGILKEPESREVETEGRVVLAVEAKGGGVLTYQWYRNGVAIEGAVGRELVLERARVEDRGLYRVVVFNGVSRVASRDVELRVRERVKIVGQPMSVAVREGGVAALRVLAGGEGPFGYQWYRNGIAVSGANGTELVFGSLKVSEGGKYRVKVSGVGEEWSGEVMVEVLSAPRVVGGLIGALRVKAGEGMRLGVEAEGSGELKYQWIRNGGVVSGVQSGEYVVSAAVLKGREAEYQGTYEVVVSNGYGSVRSVVAVVTVEGADKEVTVRNAPRVDQHPVSVRGGIGGVVTLSVGASGEGLKYQWRREGRDVPGAVAATLAVGPLGAEVAGRYEVVVSNTRGSVVSAPAWVGLMDAPQILEQPRSLEGVLPGTSAAFLVRAAGEGLVYQWRRNGVAMTGADTSLIGLPVVREEDEGIYDVRVSNAGGSVVSAPVGLTVRKGVRIAGHPQGRRVLEGAVVELKVSALGEAPLKYEWYKDGLKLSGQEGSVLSLGAVGAKDAGRYVCRVSNALGGVNSAGAVVELDDMPLSIVREPESVSVSAGDALGLRVDVKGRGPFAYQWYRNRVMVDTDAARMQALVLRGVGEDAAGKYWVIVGNGLREVKSREVEVKVGEALRIVEQPVGGVYRAGERVALAVEARGSGTMKYQWYLNGAVLAGRTGNALVVEKVGVKDAGVYEVVVWTERGDGVVSARVRSAGGLVKVEEAARIVRGLGSRRVNPGDGVSLSVGVEGAGPFEYEWRKNGVVMAGVSGDELRMERVGVEDQGRYGVRVKGVVGSWSEVSEAELKVNEAVKLVKDLAGGEMTVLKGRSAVLEVGARGSGALKYEWRRNGVVMGRAGSQRLSVMMSGLESGGVYDCVVSNGFSQVVSRSVTLRMRGALEIVKQPVGVEVNPGGSAVMNVEIAGGRGNETFRWYRVVGKKTEAVPGGVSRVLELRGLQVGDAGQYYAVVSGEKVITSRTVNVLVRRAPEIRTEPASQVVAPGGRMELRVVAQGSGPLTYQWQRNGAAIPGATGAVLSVGNARGADGGLYRVLVSNSVGRAVSKEVVVEVGNAVEIVKQPLSVETNAGGLVSLKVEAKGSGKLSYQWRKDGKNILGEMGRAAELKASRVGVGDEGVYDVVVENEVVIRGERIRIGRAVSEGARLTVNRPVVVKKQPISRGVYVGEGVVFEVEAEGSGLQVQWTRLVGSKYENIVGATGARYAIERTKLEDSGRYGVVLSGKVNTVRLEGLQLFVTNKVRVVEEPKALEVNPGESFALSVRAELYATGYPLTYQWRRNGSAGVIGGEVKRVDVVERGVGYTKEPVVSVVGGGGSGARVRAVMESDGGGQGKLRVAWFEVLSGGSGYTSVPMVEVRGDGTGGRGEVFGGGQSAELRVASAREVDDGEYDVMVYAGLDWVSSQTVRVKVRDVVRVERAMSGVVEVMEGGELVLDSGVSGIGARGEWRRNGVVVGSNEGVVYRRGSVGLEDAGEYRVRVEGEAVVGGVASVVEAGPVVVKVVSRVKVGGGVEEREVDPGERVELQRALSAYEGVEGTRYYQWKRDGKAIPGATGATYVLNGVVEGDEGSYTLEVENRAGVVESEAILLRVRDLPEVVQQPVGVSVDEGERFELEAVVAGAGLSYQWYRNGVAVSGGDVSRYVVERSDAREHAGEWVLRVTSSTKRAGVPVVVMTDRVKVELRERTRIDVQPGGEGFVGVERGGSVVLGVRASGTGLSYQWRKDGSDIVGATGMQYRIEKAGVTVEGVYQVVVRGALGEVQSRPVVVGLERAPEMVEQPRGVVVNPGESFALEVKARGSGVLRYQWKLNGRGLVGRIGSVLEVSGAGVGDAGVYECEVRNTAGMVVSMGARVVVREAVRIEEQPVDVVALPGGGASLRVVALGSGPLSYQWRKGGVEIEGARSEVLSLSRVSGVDAGLYDVVVSNVVGKVESRPVRLEVLGGVEFEELPQGVVTALGRRVSLGVRVSERTSLPVKYEWRRLGAGGGYVVVGGNQETLVIERMGVGDEGEYQCVVSNEAGAASTSIARVTLSSGIKVVKQSGPEGEVKQGDSVAFEVEVESALGVVYQWVKRSGVGEEILAGEVYSRLVLDGVGSGDVGEYVAVVSDGVNRVESMEMGLSVEEALRVEREPVGARVAAGGRVVLGVEARGDSGLRYQWRRDGVNVVGGTGAELVIGALSAGDLGWYDVRIEGVRGGVIYSRAVPVEMVQAVGLRRQPSGMTVGRGNPVAMEVEAFGDGPLQYQWLKNGVTLSDNGSVSGARSVRLMIRATVAGDSGNYSVRVSGPAGSVTSVNAPLVVLNGSGPNGGGVQGAAEGVEVEGFLDLAPVKVYEVSAVNGVKVERYEWAVDVVSGLMKWRVAPRVAGEKGGWEEAEKGSWKRSGGLGFSETERMEWVSVMGAVSGRGVNQWELSGAAVQLHGSGNARWLAPVLIGTRLQSLNGKETRWTVTVRYVRAEAGFGGL